MLFTNHIADAMSFEVGTLVGGPEVRVGGVRGSEEWELVLSQTLG